MDKDIKRIIRALEDQGFDVRRTKSGHYRVTLNGALRDDARRDAQRPPRSAERAGSRQALRVQEAALGLSTRTGAEIVPRSSPPSITQGK